MDPLLKMINKTFPAAYYQPQYDPIDTAGTMHISVVDKDNVAVAMTSTVNLVFGAFLMDLETEMDDFSLPNVANFYLLPPAKLNFIKPGKRPISSTAPTIIAGDWLGAFGASGGSQIITTAAQSILNVIDYGMDAYESVTARRVHHQLFPDELSVEKGYATTPLNALHSAGHNVTMHDQFSSYAQVVIRLGDGTINAVSDLRKLAVAAAY